MASCLGLYVESNLIKYAKVTKDRDTVKVDAFGVKTYDKLTEAINQIVAETYSFKTPISINLSDETYQYFYLFSLLNKSDLKKAIDTEFDSYCQSKGFNRNALETRYAMVPELDNNEKIKTVYISANKTEINRKLQDFSGNYVSNILPLPMVISNVAEIKDKENVLIVNIEENTTITTIAKGQIYNIEKIEEGMGNILSAIAQKENSFSKAYEICKNTTIYTVDAQELQAEESMYLQEIMPTLYNIIQKIQGILEDTVEKVDKIYITGTGSNINNIDLYFQEYFNNIKCEILKPYFIPENLKINIKDYIEVNSAIALGMYGLGYGIKAINFKNQGLGAKLQDGIKLGTASKNGKKVDLTFDWKSALDVTEKRLLRGAAAILFFIAVYGTGMGIISGGIDTKVEETQLVKADTEAQIKLATKDITTLNNKTTDYQTIVKNLQSYSEKAETNLKTKNVIPLLLTRIMNVIPKDVTLTSIENTTGTHIVINAQSETYEQLGIFKGSLILNGVLKPGTVVSTSGVKQNGIIKVVIEGDLP